MANDGASAGIPIYVSYVTFGTLLDWLKEMKVIPSQLDSSLWRTKFNGAVGSQLMGGLRFLKLLEGDQPTPMLERLALADPDERKALLVQVFRSAYGDELIDGLPRMTPRMLDDRISALGSTDATHRKAVSFFINAAKALDLNVPSNIAKKARNRPSARLTKRNGGKGQSSSPSRSDNAVSGTTEVTQQSSAAGSKIGDTLPPPTGNVTTVLFPGGETLALSFVGDLFRLGRHQREFVLRMVDQFQEFQEAEASQRQTMLTSSTQLVEEPSGSNQETFRAVIDPA